VVDRVVPGRDDRSRPVGLPSGEIQSVVELRRRNLAEQSDGVFGVEPAGIDRALEFLACLVDGLAHFAGHRIDDRLRSPFESVHRGTDRIGPVVDRLVAKFRCCARGRRDCRVDVLAGSHRNGSQRAVVDR